MTNRRKLLTAAGAAAVLGIAHPSARATTGTVSVSATQAGVTPQYVGYNMGHYLPGSTTVPQDKRLTLAGQPSQSVWLLTAPSGAPQEQVVLHASDDARVRNGDAASAEPYHTKNYGGLERAHVGRTPDSARFDYATYLQFDTGGIAADNVSRAILQLTGRSRDNAGGDPGSILFHVYALASDGWDESAITWDNAPKPRRPRRQAHRRRRKRVPRRPPDVRPRHQRMGRRPDRLPQAAPGPVRGRRVVVRPGPRGALRQ